MESSELEEGEVCFYDDDDQDLSYNIDERIEEVLGHFRKDFEGLVSAESLGSKFGGYGSFLPVDRWDSPISCKEKTLQKKFGSVRCWPVQKGFSVLVNDCASTRGSREMFGEKNIDKSMGKEKENVSCSLKKQQTATCCRKRKVGGDVVAEASFSYNNDERIEEVLGHFRKDVEGLVSSFKFGAYGSFLPVDHKSIGKEKEKENVSASALKKKLETTCNRKRKVGDHVAVEVAFVYNNDERIGEVLGNFRKDFEGLISAESLGSKFGGYGSFLPVDGQSPQKKVGNTRPPQITSNKKRKDGDITVLAEATVIIAKHSKALKSVSSEKGNAKTRQEVAGEKKIMKPAVLKVVKSHSKKGGGSSITFKSKSTRKQEATKVGSKEAHSDRFTKMLKRWKLRRKL